MSDAQFAPVAFAVERFKGAMLSKMKIRQHHGNREGWMGCIHVKLRQRIKGEYEELQEALDFKYDDNAAIMDELTDVANCCMMLWDRLNTEEEERLAKEELEKQNA